MLRVTAAQARAAAEVFDMDLEDVSEDSVSRAYRLAAKACHPDSGNYNPARWAAIRQSKEVLGVWIKAREAARGNGAARGGCRACGGSGFVQKRSAHGFGAGPRFMCVMCNGSGEPKKQENNE